MTSFPPKTSTGRTGTFITAVSVQLSSSGVSTQTRGGGSQDAAEIGSPSPSPLPPSPLPPSTSMPSFITLLLQLGASLHYEPQGLCHAGRNRQGACHAYHPRPRLAPQESPGSVPQVMVSPLAENLSLPSQLADRPTSLPRWPAPAGRGAALILRIGLVVTGLALGRWRT